MFSSSYLAMDDFLLFWLSDGGRSARLIALGIPLTADAAGYNKDRLVIGSPSGDDSLAV
jgi:hypothetical protein